VSPSPAPVRRLAGPPLVVGAALILLLALGWRFWPRGAVAGLAPVITLTGAPAEAAGPVTVNVDLDLAALRGSGPPIIPYVDLQLRDAAGRPALYNGAAVAPVAMHVTGSATGWTADMGAPTQPGVYHAHVIIRIEGRPTVEIDAPSPALQVTPPVAYRGGFVYSRNGNLWRADDLGRHTHQLTFYTGDGRADFPAWAPDGARVAFARALPAAPSEIPNTEIWSVPAGGGPATTLVTRRADEDLTMPAFGPDGAVYVTSDRTVDPATGATPTMDRLTEGRESWAIDRLPPGGARGPLLAAARMPDLSRDGRTLVYLGAPEAPAEAERPPTHTLMIANADGSGSRELVGGGVFQDIYAPRLSPDGRQVVFAAVNPTGVPDGQTLLQRLGLAPLPARANGVPWDLYLIPAAGGKPARLTNVNADQPFPAWSADSRRVAWLAEKGLFVLDLDHPDAAPAQMGPASSHGQLSWFHP
jgi:Tol biopolymer transport system component